MKALYKANGTASPSFCSYSLANINEQLDLNKQEYDIKSVAGALYVGWFFLKISFLYSANELNTIISTTHQAGSDTVSLITYNEAAAPC